MVLLDGRPERGRASSKSRGRPTKLPEVLSAEQSKAVEARVDALMSSMGVVAKSSSASALEHAAQVWGCQETAEQRRRKTVAGRTASSGRLEFKRDFSALGLVESIVHPEALREALRARSPSPLLAEEGPLPTEFATLFGTATVKGGADDVVNYWSTQAASHVHVKQLQRLNSRKSLAAQQAEEDRRFPALKDAAPTWWKVPTPVAAAAESFDKRHLQRLNRAEAITTATQKVAAPPWTQKGIALRKEYFELATNRYVEPYVKAKTRTYSPTNVKKTAVVEEKRFDLPTSIWGPRAQWCDAKDFYDTEEVRRQRFEVDWQCAIEQLGLIKVILRHDHGDDEADEDGDGLPDEVEEVGATLWECHEVVFLLYQYFAALGSDISGINFNAWSQFVDEVKLASKRSQFCKRSHFDTLFIKIDTASKHYWKGKQGPIQSDKAKSLSRVEFLGALVHIAIMRYCETGEYDDVSEAVHRLLMRDIAPKVDASISASPNDFRRIQCYTSDVNDVLRKHETSLRHIFTGIAGGGRTGAEAKLISLSEWRAFLRAIEFCGGDLTERDGRFAFVWSIMAVADARTVRGALRQSCLPFEGFLEALCRIAGLKALPTDEEVEEAGCSHAGAFMAKLRLEDENRYETLLEERGTPWCKRFTPPQPMARLVEHTITIMIHSIEGEAVVGKGNLKLSEAEVIKWLKAKNLFGYY